MQSRRALLRAQPSGYIAEAVRGATERWPRLYLRMARRRNTGKMLVDPATDLMVEGFPRSGNTFLVAWLARTNPSVRVASHLHSRAHVRMALRHGIPVVVMLRDPLEALASEMVRRRGRGEKTRPEQILWRCRRFYTAVTVHRDDLILSPFEVTTRQPEQVAAEVSRRFGLALDLGSPDDHEAAFAEVERLAVEKTGSLDELTVGRPSARRDGLAAEVRANLVDLYGDEVARLRELHDTLVASESSLTP